MHRLGITAALAALVMASACLDVDQPAAPDSAFRLINASELPIDINVDGITALTQGAATSIFTLYVPSGGHDVTVSALEHGGVQMHVNTAPGEITTAYVYSRSGRSLDGAILDTGSIVAPGRSRLRVVNLSPTAGELEIFRTQPDFPTAVRIMTPFPYLAASPYLESTAGTWEVFVAAPGDSATKLATTGGFEVASGERATVVLLDSAGTMVARLARE